MHIDFHVLTDLRAVLFLGEADLSSVMDLVGGVSPKRQQEMAAQGYWLYTQYFSTIEAVTLTTLEIINDRVFPQHAKVYEDWNSAPHLVCIYLLIMYVFIY